MVVKYIALNIALLLSDALGPQANALTLTSLLRLTLKPAVVVCRGNPFNVSIPVVPRLC